MPNRTPPISQHFSGEARLFPIPELVHFPGNVLPLHVFESRYREMVADALSADQLIAMATLKPGYDYEYYGRPPIYRTVCLGRVIKHERLPDGKYNLLLVGLRRANVLHEIEPVRSYRRAQIELIEEQSVENTPRDDLLHERLISLFLKCNSHSEEYSGDLEELDVPLGMLTDLVAFHTPLPMQRKIELLAEANPHQRAQQILDWSARSTHE